MNGARLILLGDKSQACGKRLPGKLGHAAAAMAGERLRPAWQHTKQATFCSRKCVNVLIAAASVSGGCPHHQPAENGTR